MTLYMHADILVIMQNILLSTCIINVIYLFFGLVNVFITSKSDTVSDAPLARWPLIIVGLNLHHAIFCHRVDNRPLNYRYGGHFDFVLI